MADSKITALTALTAADPANDMIPIVDVSDTPPASGNTKRISINNILACSPSATLASATITGDLTVDTNVLKVDTTNNRVGIGTASPQLPFVVSNAGAQGLEVNPNGSVVSGGIDLLCYNRSTSSYKSIGSIAETFVWKVGSAGSTTAATLDSSGNLGLGVTPSAKFHVDAGSSSEYFRGAGNSGASRALVISASTTMNAGDTHTINAGSVSGVVAFATGGTERMRLDASGRLMVNTTSQLGQFTVQGNASISQAGKLYLWDTGNATAHGILNAGDAISFLRNNGTESVRIDGLGNFIPTLTAAAPALAVNRQMVFNLTSDTNLRISVRGADGTTRTANITLA